MSDLQNCKHDFRAKFRMPHGPIAECRKCGAWGDGRAVMACSDLNSVALFEPDGTPIPPKPLPPIRTVPTESERLELESIRAYLRGDTTWARHVSEGEIVRQMRKTERAGGAT